VVYILTMHFIKRMLYCMVLWWRWSGSSKWSCAVWICHCYCNFV